jgi:predicted acylesterase/phospholipase RssA
MTLQHPKQIKRALVLGGGGAKGAYAFGCLKAFKEKGIHFDAVSGTSVGGLNALLWSTDAMSEGQSLWDGLSFSTVYPVRFLNPQKYPKVVIQMVAAFFVLLNLVAATICGVKHPGRLIISLLLTLVFGFVFVAWLISNLLSFILSVFLAPILFSGDNLFSFLIVSLILLLIPAFCLSKIFLGFYKANEEGKLNQSVKYSLYGFALIVIGICGSFASDSNLDENIKPFILFLLGLFPVILVLAHFFPQITGFQKFISFVSSYLLKLAGTVLDSTPLKNTCKEILSSKSMSIPTFITSASLRDLFVPNKSFDPIKTKLWIPYYNDISLLSPDESLFHATATAALPFGIVPSVKIGEKEFVDGGIVDNIPYYPFIYDIPTEEIYIVALETFKSDEEAKRKLKITTEEWFNTAKNKLFNDLNEKLLQFIPEDKYEEDITYQERLKAEELKEETLSSFEELKTFKEKKIFPKIKFFYPQTNALGNFLSGTLNFNGDYAKEIMEKGYLETLQKLEETPE